MCHLTYSEPSATSVGVSVREASRTRRPGFHATDDMLSSGCPILYGLDAVGTCRPSARAHRDAQPTKLPSAQLSGSVGTTAACANASRYSHDQTLPFSLASYHTEPRTLAAQSFIHEDMGVSAHGQHSVGAALRGPPLSVYPAKHQDNPSPNMNLNRLARHIIFHPEWQRRA